MSLLKIQKVAVAMNISSDLLSYISTLESINLIYSKYTDIASYTPNPDIPALQSAYLAYLAKIILTQIGYTRFNHLYEKYMNTELAFELTPNININIGNTLGIISYYYLLQGAKGIYKRDISQPIFGI